MINTLVKNASFLMIAALISKIIGMLYKSPLSNTLGNSSMGLFNYAQNVYFILLMIAFLSVFRRRFPRSWRRSWLLSATGMHRRFSTVLFFMLRQWAALWRCSVFFGSSILVPESMSGARLALKMLAPTIFLSGILVPSAGIFRRIVICCRLPCLRLWSSAFVAVFAILMSSVMLNRFSGQRVCAKCMGSRWCDYGNRCRSCISVTFHAFCILGKPKEYQKRLARDTHSRDEATGEVMKNIVLIVMPIILSSFIYNVNGFINSYMYSGIQGFKGIDHDTITSLYAEYGYYMTLINIPLRLQVQPHIHDSGGFCQYAKRIWTVPEIRSTAQPGSVCLFPFHVQLGLQFLPADHKTSVSANRGAAAQLMMLGVITIISMEIPIFPMVCCRESESPISP